MAAIVDTDVSIDALGNIRWTGDDATNTHTVLEFIQFLMDKKTTNRQLAMIFWTLPLILLSIDQRIKLCH